MAENHENGNELISNWSHHSTEGLLTSLKELELKMTEYHRQDLIPIWAQDLFPRLELLEQQLHQQHQNANNLNNSHNSNSPSISHPHQTLQEMYSDDELRMKIQHEVENKTMAIKLSYETKLSTLSFEIERLHKLLSIRPTSSEFHSLMNSVQQIKQENETIASRLSNEIHLLVNEKLSEEMILITNNLNKSNSISETSRTLFLQRIDELEDELRQVKSTLKAEFENSDHLLQETRSQLNQDFLSFREEFSEFQSHFTSSHDSFCETFEHSDQQFQELNHLIQKKFTAYDTEFIHLTSSLTENFTLFDERNDEIREKLDSLEKFSNESSEKLSEEIEIISKKQREESEKMNEMNMKQILFIELLHKLEEEETLKKTKICFDELKNIETLFQSHTQQLEELHTSSKQSLVSFHEIYEMIENHIPNLINVEVIKIEGNQKDIRNLKESLRQTRNTSLEHENQIEKLLKLHEEMIIMKDLYEIHEDRFKKILKAIADMSESQEYLDRRVGEVSDVCGGLDEKFYQRLLLNQRQVDDKLIDHFVEFEQKFQRLQDSLMSAMREMGIGSSGATSTRANGHSSIYGSGKRIPKFQTLAQMALKNKKKNLKGSEGGNGKGIDDECGDEEDEEEEEEDGLFAEKEECVDQLLELCLSFEEITGYRNLTPKEIPSKICGEIAMSAHHLADLISSSVDIESIKRNLSPGMGPSGAGGGVGRGVPGGVGGGGVDGLTEGDGVSELKVKMIQKTMQNMKKKLNETSPTSGSLQQEARKMFMNKIQQALSLAMTKHDQVTYSPSLPPSLCSFFLLTCPVRPDIPHSISSPAQVITTNNTLLGRVKIPTCIACDRPMMVKVCSFCSP
jgi:hypothetical protein